MVHGYLLVTNIGEKFASSLGCGSTLHGLCCQDEEEADGRIILHVQDMIAKGAKRVVVCCSDTDVLVVGISYCDSFKAAGLEELWFKFGVGTKQRFIPAHRISEKLGEKAQNNNARAH